MVWVAVEDVCPVLDERDALVLGNDVLVRAGVEVIAMVEVAGGVVIAAEVVS